MTHLFVEPSTPPLNWEQFKGTKPRFSIALDGYVAAGPKFEETNGPFLNLNHHEDVSRLETRATCAQALYNVRLGLFQVFTTEQGAPEANIYVNDCDHDVCLSVYILRNSQMVINTTNPLINQLVHMEDLLDTTAGAYPFPAHLPSSRALNWIFHPYELFRSEGGLDRRSGPEFQMVIDAVGQRIGNFLVGKGGYVDLDTRFDIIGQNRKWSMVREIGANARPALFEAGIHAFVSVRERPDGRFVYSIGRQSMFIPFPIPRILDALNKVEDSSVDRWGGSPTIGGSPRVNGSRLNPDEVTQIIDEVIKS